jgi:hypothetical protein
MLVFFAATILIGIWALGPHLKTLLGCRVSWRRRTFLSECFSERSCSRSAAIHVHIGKISGRFFVLMVVLYL